MKKYLFLIALFFSACTLLAQTLTLRSNGYVINLKTIDTLVFYEYPLSSGTARTLRTLTQEEKIFHLPYSTGFISGNSSGNAARIRNLVAQSAPVFSSSFFQYGDGTLEAPTSTIFLKPASEAALKSLAKYGTATPHPDFKGFYFLHIENAAFASGDKVITLCNALVQGKAASIAEPVFIKLLRTENPLQPQEWNIHNSGIVTGATPGADMGVDRAWCMATGTGIRVAVIDDGVDLTHPDLQANLLAGYDATGNNSGGAPLTTNGHGTNCAGIIASVNNTIGTIGVAYNASIIPCRMGTVDASGHFNTSDSWISSCFTEAINRGADVISNSWGGGSPSAQIDQAIQNAVNNGRSGKGCVVLFAAGNNNTSVQYPATNASVIAVGASTPCDTRKRSSSNTAQLNSGVQPDAEGTSCDGEYWWGSNFGTGLDLIAPGVLITTTDNVGTNGFVAGDYNDHFNGTSAACPNAAAVTALILSVNPSLTGPQARFILESTCFKIPNGNFQANVAGQPNGTWSNQAGYGRIDANAAVMQAVNNSLSINGPALICNSSNYFVNNLPAGASVSWSIPSSAGSVLVLSPNNPSPNYLKITNQKWYGITTLLNASVSLCGNTISVVPKTIANDNDNSSSVSASYSQEACLFYNVSHPAMSGTYSTPLFLHQGCMTQVSIGNMTGRTLSLAPGSGQPMYWNYSGGILYLQLPIGSGGIPFTFNITGDGACYQKQMLFFSYSNNSRQAATGIYTLSPNPASSTVVISRKTAAAGGKTGGISYVKIYDQVGNLRKQQVFGSVEKATVNTGALPAGLYFVEVSDGVSSERQQLKIER